MRWLTVVATAVVVGAVGSAVTSGGHLHLPTSLAVPAADAGVRGGVVTDLRWLPAALRGAGLTVVEEPGWRARGHDFPLRARAVVLHHDASPPGASPDMAAYLAAGFASAADGHYDAQAWVDVAGRWHMIAAGSAQHAGDGAGWGAIHAGRGNQESFGVETDHTAGEAWPARQYESIRRGLTAICARTGWNPAVSVVAHREYAPGRKSDPAGIDMGRLRRQIAAALGPALVREIRGQAGRGNVADAMLLGALLEGQSLTGDPKTGRWPCGDGGKSCGPFQINRPAHPDVSVDESQDPRFAVTYMLPQYVAACARVGAAEWLVDRRGAAARCAFLAEKPRVMYEPANVADRWARLAGVR